MLIVEIVQLMLRELKTTTVPSTGDDARPLLEKRIMEFLGKRSRRHPLPFQRSPKLSTDLAPLEKRYGEFLGKRGLDILGDIIPDPDFAVQKRYGEFLGKRGHEFIGKRFAEAGTDHEFLGKRYGEFLGKRRRRKRAGDDE